MKKSIIITASAVAAIAAILCLSTSCKAKQNAKAEPAFRTVIDHNGETAEIPNKINKIVIHQLLPLPSVLCVFDGSADRLIGIPPASMTAARGSLLEKTFPRITTLSTEFTNGSDLNIEALLSLEPDVVFHGAGPEVSKRLRDAGIRTVGFSARKFNYDCIVTFEKWIELLGQTLDKEDKAAGIGEYGRKVYNDIQSRLAKVEEKDKPRAMILFNYNDSALTVSGSNFFGQYWLTSTGAVNVAQDLSGVAPVNMEQIIQWDPDIIYITNFSPRMPEDLIENKVAGHDWSQIKAVKNKKVYKFPLGMYRWFPPASEVPLVLQWLAKHNQPEIFKDLDMNAETKKFYQKFYQLNIDDEDIRTIYNPSREAGKYR
ncbi:ABC transporter substrate-binding protein [Treponema lecithinolyticum]|uniref:Periplasmic binding protein n=1 Tax=Treponema lecithinolyticum ATCC 700332 TaxID=1321815 RepID=A0ABN0NXJ6_TRELE|nr:ABC transporter substrate-binding protein [Treponema lecithinolyticum]ERJ92137.1 periplasmic binding protein [Treponema lecithinolyticum ATCC 700332]